jgi:hypothetical protein
LNKGLCISFRAIRTAGQRLTDPVKNQRLTEVAL